MTTTKLRAGDAITRREAAAILAVHVRRLDQLRKSGAITTYTTDPSRGHLGIAFSRREVEDLRDRRNQLKAERRSR